MNSTREFHPEVIPRRGEWIAWTLAIIALVAWLFLRGQGADTPMFATIFVLLLLLSAASISLSNWMDRKTVLILKPEGVSFRNGLRNASLKWDQIQEVRVFPSRWGEKVHVLGVNPHFYFRTFSQVTYQGEVRGSMGFSQGEFILEQILRSSGLQEIRQDEKGHYYARP